MRTKAQISIEFMVVFSFVLIVFVLLFSLITNQRAVETNTQTFAQVQLVAQNIALQISRAAQAGNGFSTRVLLSSSISSLPFNVSITQSGLVVVTASVAKQVIRTTAYSGVPLLSSNPSFLSSISATNKIYNLPTANGSISLQNSFGTVCVDYACPTSSNQSSSVSLSMQDVHAAMFNGQNTYLETSRGFNSMNVAAQPYSFSLWVYPTASNGVLINELWQQSPTGTGHTPLLEIVSGNLWMYGAGEGTCKYLGPIATNRWTHVAETYNGATLTGYVNGTLIATASFTRSVDPTPTSQFYTLGYPNTANCGSGLPFTGEVANYQFYNVTLSGVQVKSLYNTGIGAPPLTSNGLLIWWPLNGNANDYSGNGASGSSNGPVTFPGVAQLFATVLNSVGQPLYNVTVGFTTTLGNFTNGKGTQREQTNYTNANGVATVFLNQVGNNGQALVQATAFNGNFIPNANVIAWYPLNQGQGTQVADLSGNKDYGSFTPHYNTFFPAGAVFPFWNSPNYVANFYGKASFGPQFNQQNGYVSIPTSNELNVTTAVTITGWEYVKNYSNPYATIASKANTVGSYNYAFGTCGTTGALGFYGSGITPSPGWYCANSIGLTNQWNFVSVSYNGVAIQFYLNGVPAGTFSGLGGSLTKSAGPLTIGQRIDGAPFSGDLSNLQIYNSSLTQNQIEQLYSEGIAGQPVSSSNTVGWYPLDGDSADYSSHNFNGSISGGVSFVPTKSTIKPIQLSNGNANPALAASFNGVNSYITYNAQLNLSSASILLWVNTTMSNGNLLTIQQGANSLANLEVGATTSGGNANQYVVYIRNALQSGTIPWNSNIVVNNNIWHLLGFAWNGTAANMYVDGVRVANIPFYGWINASTKISGGNFIIGGKGSYSPTANIANLQIYGANLTNYQVEQVYLQGPQGSPLPTNSLIGWWPLNGNPNDYSQSGFNSTLQSNVVFGKMINYAPYLLYGSNYSGLHFSTLSSEGVPVLDSNFPTSSGARSVFAWVNLNPASPVLNPVLFSYGQGVALGYSYLQIQTTSPYSLQYDAGESSIATGPAGSETGSWHLVGFTEQGGSATVNLWLDNKTSSTTFSATPSTSLAQYAYIGGFSSSLPLGATPTGVISDVQVYNTALTATQISQLQNSGMPVSASTPVPLSWLP